MPARRRSLALLVALLAVALIAPGPTRARTARQQGPMGAVGDYLYPHLHNLIWDPADPARVFATSPIGGWVSADAGRTWAALSPDTPNLHYGRALLDPAARTLYLYRRGDPGLHRSADFGATWPVVSDAMFYQVALAPGRPGALYALHGDWRLRRSDDGGATWRDLAQPADPPGESVFAVAPDGALWSIAAGRLRLSRDGGQSWAERGAWPAGARPRELLAASDGALVATVASDDVPSVSAKALLRSADGGATWVAAPLPAARLAVVATGPDGVLWAGSDDGRVWRLADPARWAAPGGWAELPIQLARPVTLRDDIPYTPAITDISPGPGGAVLIGTIHGIYRAATPAGPALLRARGLVPTAAFPTDAVAPGGEGLYIAATGHYVREPFLGAWLRFGGVVGLGLPRSEPFLERNLDSGLDELVQYFERGRLGMPPGQPARLSLSRLGAALLAEAGPGPAPAAPQPGCRFFPETGHSLCGAALALWERSGGLAFLGYPLADAVPTPAGAAQWFERGRVETSPAGAFLCLVGSEELQARGWLP